MGEEAVDYHMVFKLQKSYFAISENLVLTLEALPEVLQE
jgi:hypothetical protein